MWLCLCGCGFGGCGFRGGGSFVCVLCVCVCVCVCGFRGSVSVATTIFVAGVFAVVALGRRGSCRYDFCGC